MEKIKLIALDLDKTLLNDNSEVSIYNKNSLLKANDNGIILVIATGRPLSFLPKGIDQIPFKYAITKNGAIISNVETNEIIHHQIINQQEIINIIRYCQDYHCLIHGEYLNKHYYYNKYVHQTPDNYYEEHFDDKTYCDNLADYLETNNIALDKMNIFPLDQETFNHFQTVKNQFNNLNMMSVGNGLFDVCNITTSKGIALKQLADLLNIKNENICCMGDSDSDISMVEYCKLSIAMKNSYDCLKQISSKVSNYTNNEDGVGKEIELILKEDK